ncbi:MAG TPA: EamA family transporter [Acidobacteriota bacterium]|nr:EamA family transporter [Acidobacteriota bacterium]
MKRSEKFLAYASLAVVCLIWGTTYLAIRVTVRTLPDAWMAGIRFLTAGSILAAVLYFTGHKFPPVSQWKHLIFIGICLIGLGNWLVVWAEKVVPSGPAALMVATLPFYMVFLDPVIRRFARNNSAHEHRNWKTYLGLVIGFAGVILLILPEMNGRIGSGFLLGAIVLQFASAAWAVGSLYSKYRPLDSGPLVNASLQMIFGGIILTIFAWIKGDFAHVYFRTDTLIAFLYLIIFGALLCYVCYIYALSRLSSSIVSIYAYINPVIAVWLGWLILKENVTFLTIIATAIILCGVWLVRKSSQPEKAASFEEHAA